MIKVAMTIAGSDSGGGAGIQADLKTFQEFGVFGTSAITAITSQNTLGVHGVFPIPTKDVATQIAAVLSDFQVNAVKTGMLFSAEIIVEVARVLRQYDTPTLVIDPVMIAKGGASLLQQEAITAMKEHLIPMATVITPNIPEAEVLAGLSIHTDADVELAANRILQLGAKAVVMKGGHRSNEEYAKDVVFVQNGPSFAVQSRRVQTKDTHGTGCTFSAAITAQLALGLSLEEAILEAKRFIQAAIASGLQLGQGHGPTNHFAYKQGGMEQEVKLIEA